jgi:hypothetical protein
MEQAAGAARRPPWHVRLQARLADAERAAEALRAVCDEPDAVDAFEVRLLTRATRTRTPSGACCVVTSARRRLTCR